MDGHLYDSGRSRVKKVDGPKSIKLDGPDVWKWTVHLDLTVDGDPNLTPDPNPQTYTLLFSLTQHFYPFEFKDRPLSYLKTVHFRSLGPSTFISWDRPHLDFWTVHIYSLRPSTFMPSTLNPWDRLLSYFGTVHFQPFWTVHFDPRPSTLDWTRMTLNLIVL